MDDVAVVFVHGIGSQREGETLREGVESLAGQLAAGAVEHLPAMDSRQACRVRWRDSDGEERTALCVDGWWDQAVREVPKPPTLGRSLLWLLFALPALVGAAWVLGRFRNAPAPKPFSVREGCVLIRDAALIVIALPVLLVLTAAMPAALLAERLFRRRRPLAAATLSLGGDVWAFARSPAREQIIEALTNTGRELREQATRVIFVGHSQGAALCRSVCFREPDFELMTLGAGSNLLAVARAATSWSRNAYAWSVLVATPLYLGWAVATTVPYVAPMVDAVLIQADAVAIAARGESEAALDVQAVAFAQMADALMAVRWTPLDTVVIVASLAFGLLLKFGPRPGVPPEIATPTSRWVDVWSPYDPVCIGGPSSDAPLLEEVRLVNARSLRAIPTEHVTYFANPAVGSVLASVVRGSELPVTTSHRVPGLAAVAAGCGALATTIAAGVVLAVRQLVLG